MKKFLTRTALAFAVFALLVYLGLTFFLGSIVTSAVNRIGPRLTQTRVVLDGARLSPLSGSGTLHGLVVDNPPGWSAGPVFHLGQVYIQMQPFSLFRDHIIIEEITIDQPEFHYETKILSSNLSELLKNIRAATGDKSTGSAPTAAGPERPVRFEVRHLRLIRGKVTVGVGNTALTLPMPELEMRDLGTREGGINAAQLATAVLTDVTRNIVSATLQAAGKIGATGGAGAVEDLKKAGDSLKKLIGR